MHLVKYVNTARPDVKYTHTCVKTINPFCPLFALSMEIFTVYDTVSLFLFLYFFLQIISHYVGNAFFFSPSYGCRGKQQR